MKSLKKSLVTLLACTMAIAPCMVGNMPVSAAEGDTTTYSITVTKGDDAVHTYEAYQVFDGDLTEDGILSNIVWGSGVNGAALLTALQNTQNEYLKDKFTTCTSAKDVAGVLEAKMKDEDDDVDFNRAFADVVGSNLSGTKTPSDGTGKIDGLDAGYYLVKDQENTLGGEHAAYTQFILKLTDDASVTAKSVLPTLDKVIVEGEDEVEANTASIGDDVKFKLTSEVPDMTGYDKYFFVVNDTLSSGFTFNNDVEVTVDGDDADFYVTELGGGKIKIVLEDFYKNYNDDVGADIVITYSAKLNDGADLTQTGNINTANLTYSNNPNFEYTGNVDDDPATPDYPDEPNPGTPPNDGGTPEDPSDDTPGTPGEPTGDTPKITTVTYATQIIINKIDGESKNPLAGVVFTIAGKDYTTDADGKITISGLGAGEYTIVEKTPLAGYNALPELMLTITADLEDPCEWSATLTANGETYGADAVTIEQGDSTTPSSIGLEIENNKGSSLPTTGGMGTTLIYVLGGMLVLCSIVLIITRKRMEYRQF